MGINANMMDTNGKITSLGLYAFDHTMNIVKHIKREVFEVRIDSARRTAKICFLFKKVIEEKKKAMVEKMDTR